METNHYDIVIIGAGVAGMTAALYARRAGRTVLVLEEKTRGGSILPSLKVANYPGYVEISGADLTEKIYHQVNNFGADFRYETILEITRTEKGEKNAQFLVKTDETEYSCGAIILAVGTEPRKLGEKQTEEAAGRPISYCATCDGALYQDKPVVVIGSGNTAKGEIKYLEGICSKVYHIHHTDPIPAEAEAIFVAIGRVPHTSVAQNLVDLDENGYIIAGEDCHTSTEGIFVAGDARTKPLRQLVTATADGAVAASEANKYLG